MRTCVRVYVELHCHSAFSFLDGASLPDELGRAALELGYQALALTDHDSVSGLDGVRRRPPRALGLRPIHGAELTSTDGRHLTLLVEDASGWSQPLPAPDRAPTRTRARSRGAGRRQPCVDAGATCSRSTPRGWSACPAARRDGRARRADAAPARCSRPSGRDALPGRAAAAVLAPRPRAQPLAGARWPSGSGVPVRRDRQRPRARARARAAPGRVRRGARCTRRSTRPSRCGAATHAHVLASPEAMAARFAEHPEAVAETARLAERLALRPHQRPRLPLPRRRGRRTPTGSLAELCSARLRASATAGHRRTRRGARRGSRRSCAIIAQLGPAPASSCCTTTCSSWRARSRSRCAARHGRARAAAARARARARASRSIVCYLTGLSHVDPIANELLLGRFLNEELTALPDIDLDFPRDIREVLIPRVHERYGARPLGAGRRLPDLPRARRDPRPRQGARAAAGGDRAGRARRSDAARRAATSRSDIDRGARARARGRPAAAGACAGRALPPRRTGCRATSPSTPGGMVIATRPLIDCCPVRAGGDGGAPDRAVGQGLLRGRRLPEDRPARAGDALGGRALRRGDRAHARRADRPLADPLRRPARPTSAIQEAETTGVFQIESRAQMQMLRAHPAGEPRRPHRPGGARAARADPGRRGQPLHRAPQAAARGPRLRGALRAPVARAGAARHARRRSSSRTRCSRWRWRSPGFSAGRGRGAAAGDEPQALGGGDRAPTTSASSRARWRARGVDEAMAERVWRRSWASRASASPRRTAAAFGLLAYQSTWLRVHYGPEFLCALLNEQPMGFYPPDALVHEAQRRGIEVLPPDVNAQRASSCTVDGRAARSRHRPRLRATACASDEVEALVAERERGGPFRVARRPRRARGRGRRGARAARLGGRLRRARADGPAAARRDGALAARRGGAGRRRSAAGHAAGAAARACRAPPALRAAGGWERMLADYALDRHDARASTRWRCCAPACERDGSLRSRGPRGARARRAVRVGGLVVARQRPATAKGVVLHAARGRARHGQPDRAAAGLRAPPADGARRAARPGRGPARALRLGGRGDQRRRPPAAGAGGRRSAGWPRCATYPRAGADLEPVPDDAAVEPVAEPAVAAGAAGSFRAVAPPVQSFARGRSR